ncbi:MAG: hypothetical protein CMJ78_06280 [Planctomycetaceae bacterium]|nr:hypothetical protein [Planctomycetaceae bacterium]
MQKPQVAKHLWSAKIPDTFSFTCGNWSLLCVAAAVVMLSGCYSYYPYGYGPHGFGPGMQQPGGPPAGVAPQSSAMPPASINAQEFSAGALTPSIVPPRNIVRPPWNGFPDASGNLAAPVPNRSANEQDGTVNKPVPEPGVLDTPGESTGYNDSDSGFQDIASRSDVNQGDGFSEPISLQPASRSREIDKVARGDVPNPFAYDEQDYKWLRGVVEYDELDKTWHLMYSERPDDEFGGDFTLVDDAKLDVLRNNDVVYVTGRIDRSETDRLGKPCYRIVGACERLRPKLE